MAFIAVQYRLNYDAIEPEWQYVFGHIRIALCLFSEFLTQDWNKVMENLTQKTKKLENICTLKS